MKSILKFVLIIIYVCIIIFDVIAQPSNKITYQAVIRDQSGFLIKNKAIGARVAIVQGSNNGTIIFQEIYNPNPETNENGLVTFNIGGGIALSVNKYEDIDWSQGPYFIKSEFDLNGGTNYNIISTSLLNSVPYALYALNGKKGDPGEKGDVGPKGDKGDPGPPGNAGNYIAGSGITIESNTISAVDNSISNELQQLSLSGTQLSLSQGGGTVTLPAAGGGDNWGSQTVVTTSTLTGNGTNSDPLSIANNSINSSHIIDGSITGDDISTTGANPGNVLKFNGTKWIPGQDGPSLVEGSGISIIGNSQGTSYTISTSGGGITGSGNSGTIPLWNGSNSLTNSVMNQESNKININNPTTTGGRLNVKGDSGGFGISGESDFVGVFGVGNRGVFGQSTGTSGRGVRGFSADGVGVEGESPSNIGVRGESNIGTGVYGESSSFRGVWGESSNGQGVRGNSDTKEGVVGASNSGRGMWATSTSGDGIAASSVSGDGADISSSTGVGLRVSSTSGTGILVAVPTNTQSAIQALQGNVLIGTGKLGVGNLTPTFRLHLPNTNTDEGGRARANAWTTYSDKRIKSEVETIPYGLKEVLLLSPKTYFQHNSEFESGNLIINKKGVNDIGFLAQEVLHIIPEIVSIPQDENKDLWGLNYEKLTPILVKAIQEQQEIIDNLKKQMEDMNKVQADLISLQKEQKLLKEIYDAQNVSIDKLLKVISEQSVINDLSVKK